PGVRARTLVRGLGLGDRLRELRLRLRDAQRIDARPLRDRLRLALFLAGRLLPRGRDLLRVAGVRTRAAAVHDVADVVDEGVDLALDRALVAVRRDAGPLRLGLGEGGAELVCRLRGAVWVERDGVLDSLSSVI